MTRYAYMGRNPQGAAVKGIMDADNPEAVAVRLSQAGVIPVSITRERMRLPVKAPQFQRQARIKPEELIFFTRQMTTLIRAGISLTEALGALQRETQNQTFRGVLEAIMRRVEGGMTFSEALTHHPRIFSEIYIYSIQAAEAGGFMEDALARLAKMLENDLETRRRISAAFRYPIFVLITLGIGVFVLMGFVIPRFAQLYKGFNAALPLPTRIILAFGSFISTTWPVLVGGALIIAFGIRWALYKPWGRRTWDAWKLKIPVLGPLVQKLTLSRMGHILSTMVATGIPLVPALDITARAIGNVIVGREILRVRRAVEGGDSLAAPLTHSALFPPLLIQMVSVGEKTGALDSLLASVAEHYENEANRTIRNLPTILEPILLVTMAGLVLILALAVFMPLWDMVRLVRK